MKQNTPREEIFMFDTRKKATMPQELQQPLRRYVAQADGKLCGYCKENLCNTENGRMIVELYLGKQGHHILRNLVLNRAAALKKSESVSD